MRTSTSTPSLAHHIPLPLPPFLRPLSNENAHLPLLHRHDLIHHLDQTHQWKISHLGVQDLLVLVVSTLRHPPFNHPNSLVPPPRRGVVQYCGTCSVDPLSTRRTLQLRLRLSLHRTRPERTKSDEVQLPLTCRRAYHRSRHRQRR